MISRAIFAICLLSASLALAAANQVSGVTFVVANAERVAAGTTKKATIAFTTVNALAIGGTVTINYPDGFFATTGTPTLHGSSVTSLTVSAAAALASKIIITIAGAAIPTLTTATITLAGLTLGAATAGSSTGITVQTSTDATASIAVATGGINQATLTSFAIANADRVAAAASKGATIVFKTVNAVATSGTITINYPTGFLAASTITLGTSSVADLTISGAAASTTSIKITIAGAAILADTTATITLAGLTLGAATAGSSTGITVQTSGDAIASNAVATGGINQATAVAFTIGASDRKQGKTSVPVTLSFKTAAALPTNGKITLNYPSGYFATSATPASNAAGSTSVATMTATSAAPTATSIIITTAIIGIAAGTTFEITLSGLTMGVGTDAVAESITVSTDADTIPSVGVTTFKIDSAVTNVAFVIPVLKRVPASTAATLTLTFTPTKMIQIGGKITVNFPATFFAATPAPANNDAGSASVGSMTATSVYSTNSIVITTAAASAPAGTAFTITLSGLVVGSATTGGDVTIQTDLDAALSMTVSSGGLGQPVTALTVTPSSTALAATSVSVVLKFTTVTSVPAGGTITLNFPTGWFDTSATPAANTASSSSVATLTATSSIASNKIIITTANAAIPVGAFTITLTGLKTGATAVAAGKFGVSTSTDTVALEVDAPALGTVAAANNNKSVAESAYLSHVLLFCVFFVTSLHF